MAKMSMTRVRSFFGTIFVLILVILLASFGTAIMGIDVPVLSTIAGTFGVEVADE